MKRAALVTGGAGFLGSWLLRALAQRNYRTVYVLARRDERSSAKARVFQVLRTHTSGALLGRVQQTVQVVEGDLCKPQLGLAKHVIHTLFNNPLDIFHTAALADLGAPLASLRPPNVTGTKHVLEFALSASRAGCAVRVHHVSTVVVAGTLEGWFKEEQLDCGQNFHNGYERTKLEAEQLVQVYREKGVDVTVYRPGIITGDSRTGMTTNFKMFYQPLHFLAFGLFQELPAIAECLHSLVPVNFVSEAICLLSEARQTPNRTWHLVNPHEVSVGRFIGVASRTFRFRKPALIPFRRFPKERLTPLQWRLIAPYIPYLNYRLRFDATQTLSVLKSLGFEWPAMDDALLMRLFRYCIRCGFIPKKPHVPSRLPSA